MWPLCEGWLGGSSVDVFVADIFDENFQKNLNKIVNVTIILKYVKILAKLKWSRYKNNKFHKKLESESKKKSLKYFTGLLVFGAMTFSLTELGIMAFSITMNET